MAFTDHNDLFAAVHENGINKTIGQLMLQRPSLFNYATLLFTQALSTQFCQPIAPPPGGGPLFTVESQLPVLGAPQPLGLDWCLQLSNVSIDLHPGNTLTLPPELEPPLGPQHFALHLRACFGLACPDDLVVANLAAEMEAAVAKSMLRAAEPPAPPPPTTTSPPVSGGGVEPAPSARAVRAAETQPVPSVNVLCSCLDVFGVGHFEWGAISGVPGQVLKTRLDNLEIVDLVTNPPSNLESMLECYLKVVLRLGVLPRLIVPMQSLVLNITKLLQENDTSIGQHVTLVLATDVPNNPDVADDQIKVFDLFDFADTVGDLFEQAFTAALDAVLPHGLLHDLILAGIGSVADLLRTLLDIPDDFSEWLSDLFNVSLGVFNLILQFVADFFGKCLSFYQLDDPFPMFPKTKEKTVELPAVTVPIQNLTAIVNDAELVVTADIGGVS